MSNPALKFVPESESQDNQQERFKKLIMAVPCEGDFENDMIFSLARLCKGASISGLKSQSLQKQWLIEYAETNELDPEELIECVFLKALEVKVPLGTNPFKNSTERIPIENGYWPSEEFKTLAERTLAICHGLADSKNQFFLPRNLLAQALYIEPRRASRVIDAMVKNGLLERIGKYTRVLAQEYRITVSNR